MVKSDEEAALLQAASAKLLKDECEGDLAEALPALEAAMAALKTLKVCCGELLFCFCGRRRTTF